MFKTSKTAVKDKNLDLQSDYFSFLPQELTLKILLYLRPKDIFNAGQVCRSWRFICNDDYIWREMCKRDQITIFSEDDLNDERYLYYGKANLQESNQILNNYNNIKIVWKLRYIRQRKLELNWKTKSLKNSKLINYDNELLSCLRLNNKFVIASSYDSKIINIFAVDTGKCVKKLIGHTHSINIFYLSERLLISGSSDTTLKIWNVETGENYRTLYGHTGRVRCLTVFENKVVSGSSDCSIRIWNYETGTCLHILTGHSAAVRCLEYNGIFVISGSSDNTVKIWKPEKEFSLKTLEGHKHEIKSLQFDGNIIISGSLDSVRIWDVNTGYLKQTLLGYKDCFAFTNYFNTEYKKNLFAFIDFYSPFPYDKVKYEIKICESESGECIQILADPSEESSQVQCIQFILNFVLTSSIGNTVKLWDIKSGKFLRNMINSNWLRDGYYVQEFRATDTKLVCLTEDQAHKKKFILINFENNSLADYNFMKTSIKPKRNCNII